MTDGATEIVSPIGLIAAGGAMPFAVADAMVARGLTPVLFALKGVCDPNAVAPFRHHWIALGQLGRLAKLLRAENCSDLLFIGSLVRPSLKEIRIDFVTLRALGQIWASFRGGDDHLLSGIGRIFERDGFRMLGIKDVAPDLLAPAGCLTVIEPSESVAADIDRGRAVLQALGPFDIGQAVVVVDGHVVAVEDIEGTDGLLARVGHLRAQGRLRSSVRHGVLVKAPKSGQDLRYDLPTIGPRTIEGVAAAGLAGIAVAAGNTLLAEPQQMIAAADRAGLFVTGVSA